MGLENIIEAEHLAKMLAIILVALIVFVGILFKRVGSYSSKKDSDPLVQEDSNKDPVQQLDLFTREPIEDLKEQVVKSYNFNVDELDDFKLEQDFLKVCNLFKEKKQRALVIIKQAARDNKLILIAKLLLNIGIENAAYYLSRLTPIETQNLISLMLHKQSFNKLQVKELITYVNEKSKIGFALGETNDAYVREVVKNALPTNKANCILEKHFYADKHDLLETMSWISPEVLATFMQEQQEELQILMLSILSVEHSAKVLDFFSDLEKANLLLKLSEQDELAIDKVKELADNLQKLLSTGLPLQKIVKDNYKQAAKIIQQLSPENEREVIELLNASNEGLGDRLSADFFEFEDLINLSELDLQHVLREISTKELLYALKNAETILQNKIFSNISLRAATHLQEDLSANISITLEQIENAQERIIDVVKKLHKEGRINLDLKE